MISIIFIKENDYIIQRIILSIIYTLLINIIECSMRYNNIRLSP